MHYSKIVNSSSQGKIKFSTRLSTQNGAVTTVVKTLVIKTTLIKTQVKMTLVLIRLIIMTQVVKGTSYNETSLK